MWPSPRSRAGRHPLLRPRPARRIRADPLDPRRLRRRPQRSASSRPTPSLLGGFDFQLHGPEPRVGSRHRAEEAVRGPSVSPDSAIPADLDALIVAQPSTLTQPQIDNLISLCRAGGPDPAVASTRCPCPTAPQSPSPPPSPEPPGGMFGGGPPPEPKGDLRPARPRWASSGRRRDRLELVQPAPEVHRAAPRVRLHHPERRPRGLQPRRTRHLRPPGADRRLLRLLPAPARLGDRLHPPAPH